MRERGFAGFLLEEDFVGGDGAGQAPEAQEVSVLHDGVAVSGGGAGDCAELFGGRRWGVVVAEFWVEEVEGLGRGCCGAGGDVEG